MCERRRSRCMELGGGDAFVLIDCCVHERKPFIPRKSKSTSRMRCGKELPMRRCFPPLHPPSSSRRVGATLSGLRTSKVAFDRGKCEPQSPSLTRSRTMQATSPSNCDGSSTPLSSSIGMWTGRCKMLFGSWGEQGRVVW